MQRLATKMVIGSALSEGADLRLLLRLRSIAIIGQTLTLFIAGLVIKIDLPFIKLGLGVALLAAINLYTWTRLARPPAQQPKHVVPDDRVFFYQLLADIGVLTYLLFLAGGPLNPFHDMYLLPVAVAGAALPWTYIWRILVACVSGYTFVALYYVPLQLDHSKLQSLAILGEWVNHILLAVLVSYFLFRISIGVRNRDLLLAEAHANELRNGCAVAVGSVAAGVTHELATPLSTIAVLLGDMRKEYAGHPDIKPRLDLMVDRLGECKQTLGDLRAFVASLTRGNLTIPVDCLLDDVANRFRNIRPGVTLARRFEGTRPGPQIVPDIALQQAIINLLNNAGDVSPNSVALEANWNDSTLTVRVCDNGPGISAELADKLGDILVTTKSPEAGVGLGLFLTNVTMNRLGGRLRLFNREAGGACAELFLPLAVPISGENTR